MNVPEIREALLLAQELDTIVDHQDARYPNVGVVSQEAAAAIRRQQARIQELEAMLEAVGAGGVSAQRVTRGKGHIEQDLKMVAVQEPFGYFKAEPFGWRDCAETDEGAIALYEAPQPQADALDEEREKLLRALYDRGYEDRAKERDYDPLGASEFDAAMCAPRAGAARAKQADALDTERLDWLIEQGCSHGVVYEGSDKSFWMVWLDGHDAHKDKHQISRYHTAREAIDAAIAAAKENT